MPSQPIEVNGGLNPADGSFSIGQYSVIDPGHDARVMSANLTARGMAFQHGLINRAGGGLINSGGSITLVHSRVVDNGVLPASSGTVLGGGIRSSNASVSLWSSDVIGNRVLVHPVPTGGVGAAGGGIYVSGNSASVTLNNSRVLNNGAVTVNNEINLIDSQGGGVRFSGNGQAVNSLVANNRAVISGPNVDARGAGWFGDNLTLSNSSLWGNTAIENGTSAPSEHFGFNLNANHSLVRGQNPTGSGNIDATDMEFDPGFVAEGLGDYRLSATSPLLDVGDASALPADAQGCGR